MDLRSRIEKNIEEIDNKNFIPEEPIEKSDLQNALIRSKLIDDKLKQTFVDKYLIVENDRGQAIDFLNFVHNMNLGELKGQYKKLQIVSKPRKEEIQSEVIHRPSNERSEVLESPLVTKTTPVAKAQSIRPSVSQNIENPKSFLDFIRMKSPQTTWRELSYAQPIDNTEEMHDQAKQSIAQKEEVISETLAKILAQQGHLSRAKDMYKKLSLKFPEKSRYFADLIEKLDN